MNRKKSINGTNKLKLSKRDFLYSLKNSVKIALIGILLPQGTYSNSQDIVSLHTDLSKDFKNMELIIQDMKFKNDVYQMKPLDSMSHEKIVRYPISVMIKYYGLEKTQEIMQKHILIEINRLRKSFRNGLTIDDDLTKSAVLYSEQMSIDCRRSHFSKDGSDWTKRARNSGYTGKYVGEVIGYDHYSIESVIQWWKNSDLHFMEIKDRKRKTMGFGVSQDGLNIVVMFGSK